MTYDVDEVRSHFPALESGDTFFDGPGGTQVPQETIDAVNHYYKFANANVHGAFITSRRTDETTQEARCAMADFLNAPSENEIVFGPNMTTLTFILSRALGRTLSSGDEIIVTRLDHDANIAPWVALQETGGAGIGVSEPRIDPFGHPQRCGAPPGARRRRFRSPQIDARRTQGDARAGHLRHRRYADARVRWDGVPARDDAG